MDCTAQITRPVRLPLTLRLMVLTEWRDGCLVWIGETDPDGYGRTLVDGKRRSVHRLVWELSHGRPVPDALQVRHTCDNPPCVHPEHLLTGTQADNNRDARERGRARTPHLHGRANGRAKLTQEDADAIRAAVAGGESQRALARRHGVHHSVVQQIVRGQLWKAPG